MRSAPPARRSRPEPRRSVAAGEGGGERREQARGDPRPQPCGVEVAPAPEGDGHRQGEQRRRRRSRGGGEPSKAGTVSSPPCERVTDSSSRRSRVLAFGLALAQRPGLASSDTKIDLHVDPAGFLGDVASAWSSTGDLGHVQGGQYGGYLFPMGPFFALGHALGLGPWLVQRLWLGLILALAAWGAVRLMDELAGRRGVAHAVDGPARAAQPVRRRLHRPHDRDAARLRRAAVAAGVRQAAGSARGWRWPAAFALIVTASGGGRERGGHGLDARRPAAAGAVRALDRRGRAGASCGRSAGGRR